MNPTTPTTTSNDNTLFQHTTQPDWGLAILAWERGDKRGYQFQDGQLRVFKNGYFKFLEPVDRPVDESARVLAELNRVIGRQRAAKRIGNDQKPVALADQISYFSSLFPEGFAGKGWMKKHRGAGARSALKRHRDPVMKKAQELLAPERLAKHLEAGQADVIVADMLRIVESTDLVTKAQTRGMDRIDSANAGQMVRALHRLLTEEGDLTAPFDAWVGTLTRALHRKSAWALATAFPALVQPARFTAVKRTTFARAAAWLAPSLIIGDPNGRTYLRLFDMVDTLVTKLNEADLHPQDRMDAYDFIQLTLSPKAIKTIHEKEEEAEAEAATEETPAATVTTAPTMPSAPHGPATDHAAA